MAQLINMINVNTAVHSLVMNHLSLETRRRSEATHCRTCATRPRNLMRAQTLYYEQCCALGFGMGWDFWTLQGSLLSNPYTKSEGGRPSHPRILGKLPEKGIPSTKYHLGSQHCVALKKWTYGLRASQTRVRNLRAYLEKCLNKCDVCIGKTAQRLYRL